MTVTVDRDEQVGVITLARPGQRNAISPDMLEDLREAFDTLGSDDGVDGIVIQGEGQTFCAGGDLKRIREMEEEELLSFASDAAGLTEKIEQLEQPVVAAIDGGCYGGGLGLALACDLRYARSDAVFAHPETEIGMVPLFGATVRLPAAIGMTRARAMMLAGAEYRGEEASRIGLITATSKDPLEEAVSFIKEAGDRYDRRAYGLTKAMLHERHKHGRELGKDEHAVRAISDTERLKDRIDTFLSD